MVKVAFFLEDIGHARFLTNLTSRISLEEDIHLDVLVFNATGGAPRLDSEFNRFMRDYSHQYAPEFDLVIVAKDTDCRGVQVVVNELMQKVEQSRYYERTVVAAPEPHIECWYLADPKAIQRILRSPSLPAVPDSKCGRGRFKERLIQAVKDAGVLPSLGGIEYAESIVEEMDIYEACRNVPSLQRFVSDLRAALRQHSSE